MQGQTGLKREGHEEGSIRPPVAKRGKRRRVKDNGGQSGNRRSKRYRSLVGGGLYHGKWANRIEPLQKREKQGSPKWREGSSFGAA